MSYLLQHIVNYCFYVHGIYGTRNYCFARVLNDTTPIVDGRAWGKSEFYLHCDCVCCTHRRDHWLLPSESDDECQASRITRRQTRAPLTRETAIVGQRLIHDCEIIRHNAIQHIFGVRSISQSWIIHREHGWPATILQKARVGYSIGVRHHKCAFEVEDPAMANKLLGEGRNYWIPMEDSTLTSSAMISTSMEWNQEGSSEIFSQNLIRWLPFLGDTLTTNIQACNLEMISTWSLLMEKYHNSLKTHDEFLKRSSLHFSMLKQQMLWDIDEEKREVTRRPVPLWTTWGPYYGPKLTPDDRVEAICFGEQHWEKEAGKGIMRVSTVDIVSK